MGKNNNNAGIHFVKYSRYGNYDDLAYYDRNSTEGILNRRYEALARLEAMGYYSFTKQVGFINVLVEDMGCEYSEIYHICTYGREHEEEIKRVSTIKKLVNSKNMADVLTVRVHNEQRVVYIIENIYEDDADKLSKSKEYKFLDQ